ncbi:pentapeptide repeat-containing protein [Streptomyces sp. NPDC057375]|uniref:pentapeptide repeat-containing protein n=1 Tax=Streptomyces sp. NPDC057375 TaxID=3346109 RepID=UPI00363628DE
MSPGTRRGWTPPRLPRDPVAAERLREWLAGDGSGLDAVGLDLAGADLSGGDLSESRFTEAKSSDVALVGCELNRVLRH